MPIYECMFRIGRHNPPMRSPSNISQPKIDLWTCAKKGAAVELAGVEKRGLVLVQLAGQLVAAQRACLDKKSIKQIDPPLTACFAYDGWCLPRRVTDLHGNGAETADTGEEGRAPNVVGRPAAPFARVFADTFR